jgi:hypothetical protein
MHQSSAGPNLHDNFTSVQNPSSALSHSYGVRAEISASAPLSPLPHSTLRAVLNTRTHKTSRIEIRLYKHRHGFDADPVTAEAKTCHDDSSNRINGKVNRYSSIRYQLIHSLFFIIRNTGGQNDREHMKGTENAVFFKSL